MSVRIKYKDGRIVNLMMAINCREISYSKTPDGFVVAGTLKCTAKAVKPECKDCSLVNGSLGNCAV